MDNIFAMNDVLYIDEKYRGTSAAYRMFKYEEKSLKSYGVEVIILHMKVHKPFKEFAEKLGYEKVEYNYGKYIGD